MMFWGLTVRQSLLISLCLTVLLCSFANADQFGQRQVSNYAASTGTGKFVAHGCRYVFFDLVGFTGSIGNVSYSNITKLIPVPAQSQDTLGDIPYVVTSGALNILEER